MDWVAPEVTVMLVSIGGGELEEQKEGDRLSFRGGKAPNPKPG